LDLVAHRFTVSKSDVYFYTQLPSKRICPIGGHRSRLITPDTKITISFAVLAILLWAGATAVTDIFAIQAAILLVVGVIIPIIITELRRR